MNLNVRITLKEVLVNPEKTDLQAILSDINELFYLIEQHIIIGCECGCGGHLYKDDHFNKMWSSLRKGTNLRQAKIVLDKFL